MSLYRMNWWAFACTLLAVITKQIKYTAYIVYLHAWMDLMSSFNDLRECQKAKLYLISTEICVVTGFLLVMDP